MKEEFGYLKKQDYILTNITENIELIIYSAIAFLTPFLLGHPQFLVGVIVNAALVLAALNLKDYKLLPIIMIPSIAVLTRGLIFGPYTIYLIYMIPFIWIGNLILVYSFKKFHFGLKMNKIWTLTFGAILKTAFLFGSTFLFVLLGILPVMFLTTMGLLQLYTALAGGALALGIHTVKKRLTN
jgi:hypothetical protein